MSTLPEADSRRQRTLDREGLNQDSSLIDPGSIDQMAQTAFNPGLLLAVIVSEEGCDDCGHEDMAPPGRFLPLGPASPLYSAGKSGSSCRRGLGARPEGETKEPVRHDNYPEEQNSEEESLP